MKCPECYGRGECSRLNDPIAWSGSGGGREYYQCPRCKGKKQVEPTQPEIEALEKENEEQEAKIALLEETINLMALMAHRVTGIRIYEIEEYFKKEAKSKLLNKR